MAAKFIVHPMRSGVQMILERHFGPEIARKFFLILEANQYNREAENIVKQIKANQYIMEVHYEVEPDVHEFICDLYSWASPRQTELRLLRYITDKWKAGKIGKDWVAKDGRISLDITSGKHATKEEAA